MTDEQTVKSSDSGKEISGLFVAYIWRDRSVERQVEGNVGNTRYKPVFAQANVTFDRTRTKRRSTARLSGESISMSFPKAAMPRTRTHAASGNGTLHGNNYLDGGSKLAANNVAWRLAA